MTTTRSAAAAARTADLAGPAADYPRDALLHDLFDVRALLHPQAPAVRHGGRELSYGELADRSRALAARLRGAGVRTGDAVGVCGRRSPEALAAFLGVLRAGAAYVPLDDDHPPARLNAMAEDAGVRTAVVLPGGSCRIRRLRARLDLDGSAPDRASAAAPDGPPAAATDAAYTMFTSGSTGRPKPVAVPHRGVLRLAASDPDLPRPGPGDRVLHGYGLSSDASTIEIWSALLGGACLVIADREVLVSPPALGRLIAAEEIAVAYLTTSVFHHTARTLPAALRPLRWASAGGEAMDPALARAVLRACPGTRVANLYGPTENTVVSTVHLVDEVPDGARSVPIGRPLANSSCRVVRPDGSVADAGEEGELLVGGDGLALGYLGDPAGTAERFVRGPGGGRWYRTGDRAVLRADGALEYLGRVDRQLKVRGQRIEPDEVEARLREHPAVGEAAVEAAPSGGLTAYLTAAPGAGPLDPAELRAFCAEWLPGPAVPRAFTELPEFPVSAAGKVDRGRLAAAPVRPPAGPRGADREGAPAVRGVPDAVASVWEGVLGSRPGPDDDFFRSGGDSLLASEVVVRLRAMFGIDAGHGSRLIRALLDRPTPAGLAAAVDGVRGAPAGGAEPGPVDFAAEAELGFTLPPASGPPPRPHAPEDVLLTGATGFVGAFLLHRLLTRTGARVHCPVRARDAGHARRRVLANLDRYGLDAGGAEQRAVCFPGDLAAPGLGLEAGRAAELSDRLDLVLHSGAQVNFIYPYTALRAANVDGTREVVRIAAPRRVPVHFLSTVAVLSGFGAAGVRTVSEDLPLAHADRLTMGYGESKWVAEEVLRGAAAQGLPVAVHRPYEVTGAPDTGVCNTETAICSLFKMVAETGLAPGIELPMDFVPVDHLADAVLHIAASGAPGLRTYHLTNPRPAGLGDVVARMRAAGYEIRTIPYDRWVAALVEHVAADPTSPTAPFVSLCVDRGRGSDRSVKEMYLRGVFPDLLRDNTDAALAGSGLHCPPVDDALIDRYLEFFFASGYIRRPGAPVEAR
ncbi:amino acid adenylation domain-containing protein [Nocardiopsis sp. CNT-189]|uniref:amino acid adenylation domain-containing protein n=1 Tax=Nocardiopsis oceanisediminis TaxID=2816862 RepID=UPI003B37E79D